MPKRKKAPDELGRSGFFMVDARSFAFVSRLGLNAMVGYLILARGSGSDNTETERSTRSIEVLTGISRSRARIAIDTLVTSGAVSPLPPTPIGKPRWRINRADEIVGCEGYLSPLDTAEQMALDEIGFSWTHFPPPGWIIPNGEADLWPGAIADRLVEKGWAEQRELGEFRAIDTDTIGARNRQWIYLPNALVDGAAGEVSPIESVRQTGNADALRLLVSLYHSHDLRNDLGVDFRLICQAHDRLRVGECGEYVILAFRPAKMTARADAQFVKPHLAHQSSKAAIKAGMKSFWACWMILQSFGLLQFVAHLVEGEGPEAEVMWPMERGQAGSAVETALAESALRAGERMLQPWQAERVLGAGYGQLVPVLRHQSDATVVGICRLRYKPRTRSFAAFKARDAEWEELTALYDGMAISNKAEWKMAG